MAEPILAAVLSFLIPGLGQAYAGNINKGIILFVVAFLLSVIFIVILAKGSLWPWIIYVIYELYAAYDAYQMADRG